MGTLVPSLPEHLRDLMKSLVALPVIPCDDCNTQVPGVRNEGTHCCSFLAFCKVDQQHGAALLDNKKIQRLR